MKKAFFDLTDAKLEEAFFLNVLIKYVYNQLLIELKL